MYHRRVRVCIYADDLRIENALKGAAAPENLEYVIDTSRTLDVGLAKESSVVILDLPHDDAVIRGIHEARGEGSVFVVCADAGAAEAGAPSPPTAADQSSPAAPITAIGRSTGISSPSG